jgi:hypothetical protein
MSNYLHIAGNMNMSTPLRKIKHTAKTYRLCADMQIMISVAMVTTHFKVQQQQK